jgi:MinD-like ATPase involved in chromosome partitioning or flagellar assembly
VFEQNDIQMIAVWGSPNSGKTLTSVRIAKALADRREDVILILPDLVCPMLPVLLPMQTLLGESLGELLAGEEVTQEKILNACILPGRAEHLSLLGYKKGENICTHAEYTRERAVDLFILLRHLARYVVVDCSSVLSTDMLSIVAMESADKVLRLSSCELKSLSFFNSQLPLLLDRRYRTESHVKVLSNIQHAMTRKEMGEALGGIDIEIPHVAELDECIQTGRVFDTLKTKEGRLYEKGIENLVRIVLAE